MRTYLDYSSGPARVSAEIDSADIEHAIIQAYDYGLSQLTDPQRRLLERFINDVALRIKGKL